MPKVATASPDDSGPSMQILSLEAIKVDRALQSRVSTDITFQREFSEALLRGDQFPPVVVFWDGKHHWLADGFHRHGAHKMAAAVQKQFRAIKAAVYQGTKKDAAVFSAGANQKFSIPRKSEDIKKAIYMLLDDERWIAKPHTAIAKHIGCSTVSARKYRITFHIDRSTRMPELFETSDGFLAASRRPTRPDLPITKCVDKKRGRVALFASLNGNRIFLGHDEGDAIAKVEDIKADREHKRLRIHPDTLIIEFLSRGFAFSAIKFNYRSHPGLSGYQGYGTVWTAESFIRNVTVQFDPDKSLAFAVGRILLARQHADPSARAVIICYKEDCQPALVELAEGIGIELLAPDEFVASLGPKGEPR